MLDLIKPIYKQTAAYGHFGRDDIELSWEKTDKAEALRPTEFKLTRIDF
jgi:S-adenosylmethionine synthetase